MQPSDAEGGTAGEGRSAWPERPPSDQELKALADIAENEQLAREGGLERIGRGELHFYLRFAEKEGLLEGILRKFGYAKTG